MPPKAPPPTRTAPDGNIEQQCTKCFTWKIQQDHFKSVTGKRIVAVCQKCQDDVKANTAANTPTAHLENSVESSALPGVNNRPYSLAPLISI